MAIMAALLVSPAARAGPGIIWLTATGDTACPAVGQVQSSLAGLVRPRKVRLGEARPGTRRLP